MANRAYALTIFVTMALAGLAWLTFPLPAPRAEIAQPRSLSSLKKVVASARPRRDVAPILASLRQLSDTDQAGLDRLFAQLRQWIESDPATAVRYFDSAVPTFANVPLEESFFLIHGFLTYGPEPEKRALAILRESPPRTVSHSHHVGEMTSAERFDRVKAFTLRHFPRGAGRAETILPELSEVAGESRSLDVAREAVLLIRAVGTERDVEEAVRHRPEAERAVLTP